MVSQQAAHPGVSVAAPSRPVRPATVRVFSFLSAYLQKINTCNHNFLLCDFDKFAQINPEDLNINSTLNKRINK